MENQTAVFFFNPIEGFFNEMTCFPLSIASLVWLDVHCLSSLNGTCYCFFLIQDPQKNVA